MIFSYYYIVNSAKENSAITTIISGIQHNLSESHIHLENYILEKNDNELTKSRENLNEARQKTKTLENKVVKIVGHEDQKMAALLHEAYIDVETSLFSYVELTDRSLPDGLSYSLNLKNYFSSTFAALTKFKQAYIEYYQHSQSELRFTQRIIIIVTSVLFISLIIWIFVYVRERERYQTGISAFNERYRTYFNETHEGIFRIEFKEPIPVDEEPERQAELYYEHGYIAECNDAFAQMYGADSIDDLIGSAIIDFHGFDNFKKNFNETIELAKNDFHVENQITIEQDKNGSVHYFSNNAFSIIEDGKVRRIWGTQRDVTSERMEAEERKILMLAVEQSQVSIVITDINGNIEYVNPKFEEVTGYSNAEVIGKNPRFLKSGLDYESTYKNLWETIAAGKTWSGTLHNKKKNGDLFFESASISPIFDESGRIRHFLAVKEDITELTEAQHELNNYKDYLEDLVEKRTLQLENRTIFLRTLIDTIPNPVFVKDREGKYTDVNKAFVEFFGVEFDDVIGKDITHFADKEVSEKSRIVDHELLEDFGTRTYESYAFDKNHNKIAMRIFKASFGPEGKVPEGIAGLMIDISESKKTEAQMKRSLEQEKELNEMKTNFISMASHELRTPLTAIYSSTELLEMFGRKWPEEKYKEHISRIKYSVDNLTDLMEDLLTLSRVDTGKIKFNPHSLNLKNFVEKIVHNMEALKLDSHNLKLEIDLDSEFYILDEKLINYIVQNLLSNALKYSPNGGEVKLSLYDDENNIYLKIRDEGIGIAEDEFDKLFEPFHRAKNSADFTGTGLGLSIVKEAVELHKGEITVRSEENEWTEFEIYLPIIN